MYRRIISVGILSLALVGCSNQSVDTVEVPRADMTKTVHKLADKIQSESLDDPSYYDDSFEYKKKVAELRPLVDDLQDAKPKTKAEHNFTDNSDFMRYREYLNSLDKYVELAEDDSLLTTMDYFYNEKLSNGAKTKDVMSSLIKANSVYLSE